MEKSKQKKLLSLFLPILFIYLLFIVNLPFLVSDCIHYQLRTLRQKIIRGRGGVGGGALNVVPLRHRIKLK